MPFGRKPNAAGAEIDFDAVYSNLIAPSIDEAGMEPIRADNEAVGGLIHKPMYERLILCEYAVADLTTANANVFYELGLRHAARPRSTILLFSKDGKQLPFDVGPLRAIPYELGSDGVPVNVAATKSALVKSLLDARKAVAEGVATDSPVFQLVEGYSANVEHAKTDVFREQVQYSTEKKKELAIARKRGVGALRTCQQQLGALADREAGVIIDLFLSYRAVEAWQDMIDLVEQMPRPLAATAMVQEQLALALNRAGRGEEAEQVLKELLERRGPSSETYGILGRIYKDRWEEALGKDHQFLADGLLDQAIDAYRCGFEADWRDAYPGVNAVTLMEIKEPPDPQREQLLPVVTYAAERRIATGKPNYWDYATRLELAVLARDEQKAKAACKATLPLAHEQWEPRTTARNLQLIRKARERRSDTIPWAFTIEQTLERRAEEIEQTLKRNLKA
jgi:tetratricopeptide (TPR) repeat protein